MTGRGKRKEAEGGIIRVSGKNKERLEALRHPGQSYDGFVEEMLDFWEEGHPKSGPRPISQQPTTPAPTDKSKDASWWWWPEQKIPHGTNEPDGHRGTRGNGD